MHETHLFFYENGGKGSGHADLWHCKYRVLGLGLETQVLGLASSGLGLDVTGLVNNHCHVYHVIINCVNVTITITIATTIQDFHHQLRNLECHSLNIIQPAKHLQQMDDNWSDSWRIIWTISMHHHSIVSKTACQTFVKRVTSPLCCHFLNECCVLQQVRNQWSEYFHKVA